MDPQAQFLPRWQWESLWQVWEPRFSHRYGGFSLGAGSSQALPSAAEVDQAVLELRVLLSITPVRLHSDPGSALVSQCWETLPHAVFLHPGQPLRSAPGQPQPLHRGFGRPQEYQGVPRAGGSSGVRAGASRDVAAVSSLGVEQPKKD